jgi:hypothetical protein
MEKRIGSNWDKMDKAAREQARSTLQACANNGSWWAEWYGGLKNSTAEAWEQTKAGFSGTDKSLRRAWEKAEGEYQEGEQK